MDAARLAAGLGALGLDGAVSTGDSDRTLHSEDLTFHRPHRPDVVVFARTTTDVSQVLRFADDHRVPVVPFGAGSSLEGHVIPIEGGISIDLTGLDEIVAIRPSELTVTAGAGVTRLTLERRLGEHGLFFPVDPGADASLGGMAATDAAGTMTVRYGKMRQQVLGLEAVLAGGKVIRTGSRATKTSAGYDTTGLLVGSEGTLGVITELTLRVRGIPAAQAVVRATMPDVSAACAAACSIVATGIDALRIELLDDWEVEAMNLYADTGFPAGALLFVEVAGSAPQVDSEVEEAKEMLREAGATNLEEERDPTRRARLWRARHEIFFAEKAMAPGKASLSTDTCVPLGELDGALRRAREAIDRLDLVGGISAHAGDGNFHVALLVDPDDAEEMTRVDRLTAELVDHALAHGGTCTGEHGIGLGKIEFLEREHGDQLELMRAIKRAFDPNGVMNPGKVLA
ncbi:MAG: FAD-binding protein [Actinobacteria bacterium]|nr:FAD-binding protein [Actinomycetota bacterium]